MLGSHCPCDKRSTSDQDWDKQDRFYIFDHQHLHQLAQQALEANKNNTRGVIDHIVKELRTTHGPAIASQEEWFFNNAGGAMGAMTIIHGVPFLCTQSTLDVAYFRTFFLKY